MKRQVHITYDPSPASRSCARIMKIFNLVLITFLVVCLFQTGKAHAAIGTGKELLSYCESGSTTKQAYCFGYIEGFYDYQYRINLIDFYSKLNNKIYLFPKTCYRKMIRVGQLKKIVVKWLNDHLDQLHEDATFLVVLALRKAFPCEAKEESPPK